MKRKIWRLPFLFVDGLYAFLALIKTLLILPLLPFTLLWNVREAEEKFLEESGQEPTLFVHGFLASEKFWFYHYRSLEKKGVKNLFTVQLGGPFSSIESSAEAIDVRVKQILKDTKKQSVRLVCHSMGGLAALYYIKHLQGEKSVSLCIAIGSPFLGTAPAALIAKLFVPCKQMVYKNSFVRSLSKSTSLSEVFFVHIYSRSDLIVWPHTTSYPVLSKKRLVVELQGVGHIQMLFSTKLADLLAQFLHL